MDASLPPPSGGAQEPTEPAALKSDFTHPPSPEYALPSGGGNRALSKCASGVKGVLEDPKEAFSQDSALFSKPHRGSQVGKQLLTH